MDRQHDHGGIEVDVRPLQFRCLARPRLGQTEKAQQFAETVGR
jgi:hypothetical protein